MSSLLIGTFLSRRCSAGGGGSAAVAAATAPAATACCCAQERGSSKPGQADGYLHLPMAEAPGIFVPPSSPVSPGKARQLGQKAGEVGAQASRGLEREPSDSHSPQWGAILSGFAPFRLLCWARKLAARRCIALGCRVGNCDIEPQVRKAWVAPRIDVNPRLSELGRG